MCVVIGIGDFDIFRIWKWDIDEFSDWPYFVFELATYIFIYVHFANWKRTNVAEFNDMNRVKESVDFCVKFHSNPSISVSHNAQF